MIQLIKFAIDVKESKSDHYDFIFYYLFLLKWGLMKKKCIIGFYCDCCELKKLRQAINQGCLKIAVFG